MQEKHFVSAIARTKVIERSGQIFGIDVDDL